MTKICMSVSNKILRTKTMLFKKIIGTMYTYLLHNAAV